MKNGIIDCSIECCVSLFPCSPGLCLMLSFEPHFDVTLLRSTFLLRICTCPTSHRRLNQNTDQRYEKKKSFTPPALQMCWKQSCPPFLQPLYNKRIKNTKCCRCVVIYQTFEHSDALKQRGALPHVALNYQKPTERTVPDRTALFQEARNPNKHLFSPNFMF